MILLDPYINFLVTHKLTQRQYLLLQLLHEERADLLKTYKDAFPSDNGRMLSDYLINDLITRGFIVKTKTGYKIGDNFLKLYVDEDVATDEIYRLYPAFINNKGVDIPLTTMDRRVFAKIYINKIKGNHNEHLEVLKDISYAIDANLITVGIEKFLTSEQWKVFRELRGPLSPSKTPQLGTHQDNDF